jgi:predicted enzyme related to lactoylglutathione lyase
MAQPVAFFEVISADAERARKFYGELFDWQVAADPAMGGYALVDTGAGEDAVGGGIGPSSEPGDTGVKIYVKVDDLETYLARAESLGGKRLLAPTPLPGAFGTIAVFTDPDGNQVGLWA